MPFYRTKIRLRVEPSAVCEEIARVVRLPIEPDFKTVRSRSGNEDFVGELNGARFEIQRITGYRNSFLPKIYLISAEPQPRVS